MRFNPLKTNRKKMRLKEYNYPLSAYYFITICTSEKQKLFGEIKSGQMHLSNYGTIALNEWHKIFERYQIAESDVVQIMPNHFHAIILVEEFGDNNKFIQKMNDKRHDIPTISKIIGAYKSLVANECLKSFKVVHQKIKPEPKMGKIWHRSFWERIIRTDHELKNVQEYIRNNPANWSPKIFQQTEM